MPVQANKYLQYISIKGAKVHNLKNLSIDIPRDRFVVITGLSGSGKSSLAFDTLYAEGQRRYVESLSAYARQFLGRMQKPEVDFIKGIPPAVAIKQKVNTHNPRSTVGTSTEVYDYLKLLFARIGKTFSPISGNEVVKHYVSDVYRYISGFKKNTKIIIFAPVPPHETRSLLQQLTVLQQQGFARIELNNELVRLEDCLKKKAVFHQLEKAFQKEKVLMLAIDRVKVAFDDDSKARIDDSVQTAFFEGKGSCIVKVFDTQVVSKHFSNRFELDGQVFESPSEHLFNFNSPAGACKRCEGFGNTIGIDENLVIPDKTRSVFEGAVACWKGEKMGLWKTKFLEIADLLDFPVHTPYFRLSQAEKDKLWEETPYFGGINVFFKMLEGEMHKIQYRVMLSRYRGKTTCPECKGSRLKKAADYVKIASKTISELVQLPLDELSVFFDNLELNEHDFKIAKRLLIEITSRLQFLNQVGLSYLNLNRLSSTLSGGESQRINLATSLGSSLVGSMYILDEPSIGLHPRDTELLISVLQKLQQLGNSVLVVEHDTDIIKSAHQIIDIGPKAGVHGGELVFQGSYEKLLKEKNSRSLTAQYLKGEKTIPVPESRRNWNHFIQIKGARENNLKNIDVKFPLNILTVVTGVSGSGKSSLVKNILYHAISKELNGISKPVGEHSSLSGSLKQIHGIEFIDQNPIGKSSRSNPVTYLKAYDEIRKLFSRQQASVINGFKPAHFSFNVDGGRCEACQGEGIIRVEMQFMADVFLVCEHCHGKRFKEEVLEVKYRGKNIFDILELTVNEAIDFFSESDKPTERKIVKRIQPLADVGLSYIKLGQASSTLSGGESQRVKLASFLSMENRQNSTLFIFDEPTTGLHLHDISKLLQAFNELIKKGHSVLIIEHNLEIIKSADWLIDLGAEGGKAGGNLIFEGTPEELAKCQKSHTASYLRAMLP